MVDGRGMTVYFYTKDIKGSGTSNCAGGCLALWPAVKASSGTPKVDGVTGTVGTITRDDGPAPVGQQSGARDTEPRPIFTELDGYGGIAAILRYANQPG